MIAAIVPAAGHSQRMGRPKLILPIEGTPLVGRVVAALRQGGASPVIVVAPPEGAAGAESLGREALAAGAKVLRPNVQPADMRASVELALRALDAAGPAPTTVLLTPGDSPGLSARLVSLVIARAVESPDMIIVPIFEGKRGHPVAIPWSIALAVHGLPPGVGVNSLIALHADALRTLEVDEPGTLDDLDTPEDYLRWSPNPEPT